MPIPKLSFIIVVPEIVSLFKNDVELLNKATPDTFKVLKIVVDPLIFVIPEIFILFKKDVEPFIKVTPDTFKLL